MRMKHRFEEIKQELSFRWVGQKHRNLAMQSHQLFPCHEPNATAAFPRMFWAYQLPKIVLRAKLIEYPIFAIESCR